MPLIGFGQNTYITNPLYYACPTEEALHDIVRLSVVWMNSGKQKDYESAMNAIRKGSCWQFLGGSEVSLIKKTFDGTIVHLKHLRGSDGNGFNSYWTVIEGVKEK